MIQRLHSITAETLPTLTRLFSSLPMRFADFTAGYQYMWAADYASMYGDFLGVPLLSACPPEGERRFALLTCLPEEGCASFLTAFCRENGGRAVFGALDRTTAIRYANAFSGRATLETDMDTADYLYTRETLTAFPGRRLAAKRNHINAFLRDNTEIVFQPLTEENRARAAAFLHEFRESGEDDTLSAHAEGRAAERLLSVFPYPSAIGFLLSVRGDVIGLSLGEIRGDCFYMHVEKARREIRGAYPYLVREALSKLPEGVRYANREEDDGDEGLRRSKHSYMPAELLEKYTLTLEM